MTDERLERLISDAAATYRVPKDPPLDAMWARIEREHFDAPAGDAPSDVIALPRSRAPRRWLAPAAGIAAALVLGIGIGRYSAQPTEAELPAFGDATASADSVPLPADPLQRTTSSFLRDAETLLASAPLEANAVDADFVATSRLMLSSTRLLLDSPAANDPVLRSMLEDLELILAQFARLRSAPRAEELTFIADAMDERDVVPRLRTVAAALSQSDY